MGTLSTLTNPISPYLTIIKVAAAVVALGIILFLGWRNHSLDQQVGILKQADRQAQLDNKSLKALNDKLTSANTAWAAVDAANKEKIDGLTQQISDQSQGLVAARQQLAASQKAEISPAAVALREVRIDSADPQLALRLRAAAANAH